MTIEEAKAEIDKYYWQQFVPVMPGLVTPGEQAFAGGRAEECCEILKGEVEGRSVLDIGCRDGMHAFHAERLGASSVLAIDNDLSPGAVKFLAPFFKSRVVFEQRNLYTLRGEGDFDVVLAFGLLYHLRMPFYGLRVMVDCLKPGGTLLLETAIYPDHADLPLLYCPSVKSPYEGGSCTFFNATGLVQTLGSMGMERVWERRMKCSPASGILRMAFKFTRTGPVDEYIAKYWYGEHDYHSTAIYRKWQKGPQ